MGQQYNAESIKALKGADRVRKRPAVIFGTNDQAGCFHAIFEIIANSVDEAREGKCTDIWVEVRDDGSVLVRDNGRGVPMGWNEAEERFAWEMIFDDLYAGGKMDESAYGQALGMNGLGAASCQYASEWFRVTSWYEGKAHTVNFKKGRAVGKLEEVLSDHENGTEIEFKPDREVFTDITISCLTYLDALRRQAIQIPELTFHFKHPEANGEVIVSFPAAAKGFLDTLYQKQYLPNGAYNFTEEGTADDENGLGEYNVKMKVAFTFSREEPVVEVYHNGSPLTDGGSSQSGLEAGLTVGLTEMAHQYGKLPKGEKLVWKDIAEIFGCVLETYCPGTRSQYKNQTKTAINNVGIGRFVASHMSERVIRWCGDNRTVAERVINEVLLNKKARESAESVKKKVINKLSKDVESRGAELPEKFIDCQSRDSSKRELYIVEGDSALGSVKLSRNGMFQAVMPVRGKILNCLKADLSHILNNDIIIDLWRVLGCGLEVQSKHIKDLPKFDLKKLKYNKIVICTDADVDGYQIRCLLLTMFYRLAPTLLREGKVFIVETPLFEITYKGDKDTAFAYSIEERDKILEDWKAKGYNMNSVDVARSKGLGENNPEMMAVSTMRPETRRMVAVKMPEMTDNVISVFEALLGNDLESRKYLIRQYMARNKLEETEAV